MVNNKSASLPNQEVAKILSGDLTREVPQEVRNVLLDVILIWASLDMATAFYLSSIKGLDPSEGANRYGRKEIAEKLKKAAKALFDEGKNDTASEIQKIAADYPDKAFYRKRIAHSRLVGVRASDSSRLVFLPFENEGPPGNLAMEVLSVELFSDAFRWAQAAHVFFMALVDQEGFFSAEA
ncbi:hypothetical protein [Qipengyuania sp. ASV99]|uniref:hypothetical protein n=1 Tax=Qipengyuania sp. ASV99 TaxID=3399681 RepID=UPI003A4C5033